MQKYKTIDDYINDKPIETREALTVLRNCIFEAVPYASEIFNYNIPAFALIKNGKREQRVMIAGYKKHVGLYPYPATMNKFSAELKNYTHGKGSVQFPVDKPLPCELIVDMIKYRKRLIDEES